MAWAAVALVELALGWDSDWDKLCSTATTIDGALSDAGFDYLSQFESE
jgi:hypothetical protein